MAKRKVQPSAEAATPPTAERYPPDSHSSLAQLDNMIARLGNAGNPRRLQELRRARRPKVAAEASVSVRSKARESRAESIRARALKLGPHYGLVNALIAEFGVSRSTVERALRAPNAPVSF